MARKKKDRGASDPSKPTPYLDITVPDGWTVRADGRMPDPGAPASTMVQRPAAPMTPEDLARAFSKERDRHGKWLTLPDFAERVGRAHAKAIRMLAAMLPKVEVHAVVLTGLSASPTKRLRIIEIEIVAGFVEVVTVDDLYEEDGELRSLKAQGERDTRMFQAIKRAKPLHEIDVDDVALANLLIGETSLQATLKKQAPANVGGAKGKAARKALNEAFPHGVPPTTEMTNAALAAQVRAKLSAAMAADSGKGGLSDSTILREAGRKDGHRAKRAK